MDKVYNKLRNLDAYPKINEDFSSRTASGGVITLVSSIVIALLFLSEFRLYLHTVTDTKLVVDTSRGGKLRINFDVTFPAIPCTLLSLDTMDISGERHLDIRHDIFKKRIDSDGNVIEVRQEGIGAPKIERPLQRHGGRLEHNETYCGSCYGAETSDDDCCNSCEEVREAYRKRGWGLTNTDLIDQCKREGFVQKVKEEVGEGCNIHGSLEVNKVAGNFHFAPGRSFHQNSHLLDLLALQTENYNISHKINKLSFGDSIPGIVNPLDGVQWVQESPNGVYQYFTKVVPTIYTNIRGHTIQSNQFSVTEHYKSSEVDFRSPPGVFFFYDLSPIKVTFTEAHTPFLHFLTHICAIVGGIFTVAGIVDSFVYHGQKAIRKKSEIGKLR
ncbi:UNVERIFIED_CONTAM: Endoplasmic reticulum-Golgi intermediate compartment protein 3 [Sesamum latifolium]|uniref:Endoplasmic reticulum-Golgi intermediate compartment protein 3 n=1 Tax=Sesamum latifolium TaxID=2727402 RepID=A0AAW2V220_9LAMI